MHPTIRDLSRMKQRVDAFILVKATPEPSATYGDTVCVAAALLENGETRGWIRLYPVPFRYLDGPSQFQKYSMINVGLRESANDPRPESAKIDISSIRTGQRFDAWKGRHRYVGPLEGPTMCELIAGVDADANATSLGAVRPSEVKGLLFEDHGPWTSTQQRALDAYAAQTELGEEVRYARPLEPPTLTVRLLYKCATPSCRGHRQRIIDWELTALQRNMGPHDMDALKAGIRRNFCEIPFGRKKSPLIFVGNQANPVRRGSFTVLGLYYPDMIDASPALF